MRESIVQSASKIAVYDNVSGNEVNTVRLDSPHAPSEFARAPGRATVSAMAWSAFAIPLWFGAAVNPAIPAVVSGVALPQRAFETHLRGAEYSYFGTESGPHVYILRLSGSGDVQVIAPFTRWWLGNLIDESRNMAYSVRRDSIAAYTIRTVK